MEIRIPTKIVSTMKRSAYGLIRMFCMQILSFADQSLSIWWINTEHLRLVVCCNLRHATAYSIPAIGANFSLIEVEIFCSAQYYSLQSELQAEVERNEIIFSSFTIYLGKFRILWTSVAMKNWAHISEKSCVIRPNFAI